MYFLIENDDLLRKYNTICDKVISDIRKILIASLSTTKKILETKIKYLNDEATNFHNKEISEACFDYTCFAVISADSSLKKMKSIIKYSKVVNMLLAT